MFVSWRMIILDLLEVRLCDVMRCGSICREPWLHAWLCDLLIILCRNQSFVHAVRLRSGLSSHPLCSIFLLHDARLGLLAAVLCYEFSAMGAHKLDTVHLIVAQTRFCYDCL